ncbi:MAG: NAD(P)-dependent alcohol dehydrogenase [Halioglobus sp.]|nr:NAD(P)-dependent alcohol dehydrogenase [Halioglobus sp.]
MKSRIAIGVLVALTLAIAFSALLISHTSPCEPSPALAGGTARMQAIVYRCYGPPEVLQYEEVESPVPAEDEVLVSVRSASVNPLDWHYMRGSPYLMRLGSGLGAPKVQGLGTDFAGTVEAVGRKVTRFKPGDEVFGGGDGSFAQQLVVRESGALAAKPANVSFEQAAAIPIAGVTALQALRDEGGIKPGMKVLINGASGGVGTFAVQLAKHFGAEVTGVSSTRNVELVRSLGADHVIDYTREDYTAGGRQYDLILDNVGNHSPWKNSKVMTADGTLVMIGGPGGDWIGPLGNPLAALALSPFVDQEFVVFMAQLNQQDLALLAELAQSGAVTPVIERRFPLAEVPAAISYSEEGRARGKIVIDVEQPR